MDDDKNIQLNRLKQQQKYSNLIKETEKIKLEIIHEIPFFDKRYRFISDHEIEKVNDTLRSLPRLTGSIPDFKLFHNVICFEPIERALSLKGNAWCKFATGGNYNEFMPYGSIHSFIEDVDYWLPYGSPLYLLCENKQDIIFIDWHTHAIMASIPTL